MPSYRCYPWSAFSVLKSFKSIKDKLRCPSVMLEGVDLQPACGALKQCPVVIPSNAYEMMTVVAIQLKVSEKNWRTCIAFQIF